MLAKSSEATMSTVQPVEVSAASQAARHVISGGALYSPPLYRGDVV